MNKELRHFSRKVNKHENMSTSLLIKKMQIKSIGRDRLLPHETATKKTENKVSEGRGGIGACEPYRAGAGTPGGGEIVWPV